MHRTLFLICLFASNLHLPAAIYADIETNYGTITAELYHNNAPKTVANFISLAEGSRAWLDPNDGIVKSTPFYDGLTFHRVVKNFVIQGGDRLGNGTGSPGYTFPDETDNGLNHTYYSLSMANSGPNTNGSQFFIISGTAPTNSVASLNGKHTVFGRVTPQTWSVVDTIENVPTETNASGENSSPVNPVTINSVAIRRTTQNDFSFDALDQDLPIVTQQSIPSLTYHGNSISLLNNQSQRTELRVFSSPNLSTWNYTHRRYSANDNPTLSTINIDPPTTINQHFYRAAIISYADQYTSPGTLSDKRFTFRALLNDGQTIGIYHVQLNSNGTGTWESRNSSNNLVNNGNIFQSSHSVTPYGGFLTLESNNFPGSTTYQISYELDYEAETETKWPGFHRLYYTDINFTQSPLPMEIAKPIP